MDGSDECKILVGKPRSRRLLEKTRYRTENNIKQKITILRHDIDWPHVVRNRDSTTDPRIL
jgi:hypothetical protein